MTKRIIKIPNPIILVFAFELLIYAIILYNDVTSKKSLELHDTVIIYSLLGSAFFKVLMISSFDKKNKSLLLFSGLLSLILLFSPSFMLDQVKLNLNSMVVFSFPIISLIIYWIFYSLKGKNVNLILGFLSLFSEREANEKITLYDILFSISVVGWIIAWILIGKT